MTPPVMTETIAGDGGTLDLISKLPDELLVGILSHLRLNDAVKTCLVSKRWQYLWTSIDNLTFVCYSKTVKFLDYAFAQLTCSKIRKFDLDIWGTPNRYNSHIEQWLSYAIKNNVEHAVVRSVFEEMYTLPRLLYTCSSLISLDLYCCTFDKMASVISWKSLKTVKIIKVELDDEDIVKLLSGCPMLETVVLSSLYGFRRLEINNSNLKTLKFKLDESWTCEERGDRSVEIVAPYLQHLEVSGRIVNVKCRLLDVSSLVSAVLTFHINGKSSRCPDYHHVYWTLVQDYLQKLSHVAELTIASWFAEVLQLDRVLQLDGVQLPELKCKCLTLKMHIRKHTFYGVASLLRTSPHLETLNIDLKPNVYWHHCCYLSSYLSRGDNIDLESWMSNCVFTSLKSANISCYGGICRIKSHDRLFELSEFLLKNVIVLEKLVIIANRGECYCCSKNCVSPYLSQLAAKLSGCPRPPSNFVMFFHESDFSD